MGPSLNRISSKTIYISLLGLLVPMSGAAREGKPNIIYILADDLGYGDLSCFGQEHFSTPNLDRLAEEGMRFTSHYAGCSVSAPSRSVLMSGLHMGHTDIRGNYSPVSRTPSGTEGQLPLSEDIVTVAEMLKTAGYVTGAFGKWGLGYPGSEGDPTMQGFDEFFGYNCQVVAHRYYPTHLWHNQDKVQLEGNDWTNTETFAPDVIHGKAIEFIRQNSDSTFFLYYPTNLPHAELIVPEDDIYKGLLGRIPDDRPYNGKGTGKEDYGPDMVITNYCLQPKPRTTYAAMVSRIDRYVGEICALINELGLEENTVIIFASDNGPHPAGGADPDFFNSTGGFRGLKRDLYEGGIRTPMIIKWKGHIAPSSESQHVSAFYDVKPTLAEIAGTEITEECDGISFLPELMGKRQKKHNYLYWEFHEGGGSQAVRMGKWKGVRLEMTSNPDAPIELYDLENDPWEKNDLSSEYPAIVKRISDIMDKSHTRSERFPFRYEILKGI